MIFGNYYSLARKGSFAILDQGLFAGTNFIVYILLARWLEPSQYGAFALAFSVFLFFGALYTAAIIEPMLVFGSSKYKAHQRRYTAILTYMHVYVTIPLGLLLLVVAFPLGYFYTTEVKNAMIGLSISSPMILFLWLIRRAFYVRFKPVWSAMGGLLYLLLFIGIIVFMHKLGRLTHATAFVAMGCTSLAVALILLYVLSPQWRRVANPTLPEIAREHWKYGRWALGTASLTWIPSNVYYVVLPPFIGLSGVAVLRALANVALPAQHVITALCVLLLPLLARYFREKGKARTVTFVNNSLVFFLTASCLYLLILLIFKTKILAMLYGDQYQDFLCMVPIIGFVPIAASIIGVLGSVLRAMERPDRILWAYFVSSIVALVLGIFLAYLFGIQGAIWGLVLSSFTTGTMLAVFYRNMVVRRE